KWMLKGTTRIPSSSAREAGRSAPLSVTTAKVRSTMAVSSSLSGEGLLDGEDVVVERLPPGVELHAQVGEALLHLAAHRLSLLIAPILSVVYAADLRIFRSDSLRHLQLHLAPVRAGHHQPPFHPADHVALADLNAVVLGVPNRVRHLAGPHLLTGPAHQLQ